MNKVLILIVWLVVITNPVLSQSESKIISDARKYFPEFSSCKITGRSTGIQNFTKYTIISLEATKNAGFKCTPNAKAIGKFYIEYWNGKSYKQHGVRSHELSYSNMKKPSFSNLINVAKKEDPLNLLNSSELWSIVEFHDIKIPDDADVTYLNENKVRVGAVITISKITANRVVSKLTSTGSIVFSRSDCNSSFTTIEGGGFGSNKKTLEEKTYTIEEMKVVKQNTIGRKRAEKKAEEEWNALVKIEIPQYENFNEMVFYYHKMFMYSSPEQIKSLLYHTTPSYNFMEGSKYLLDYGVQNEINNLVNKITTNSQNYRTNYCDVFVHKEINKNSYKYYTKDKSASTWIQGEMENGKWKIGRLDMYFSDKTNLSTTECPKNPDMVDVTDSDYGFSIMLPSGYKKSTQGKAVIYQAKFNDVEYFLVANKIGKPEGPDERLSFAKRAAKNRVHDFMFNSENYNEWELNGTKGMTVKFWGKPKNQSGGVYNPIIYKCIWIGDIAYEISIINMNFSPFSHQFFDSFKTELKSIDKVIQYKVGDKVFIRGNGGKWVKGVVQKVDGKSYEVICKEVNLIYTGTADMMKMDNNSTETVSSDMNTEKEPNSSSESNVTEKKENFEVGDYVLIYLGKDKWEKARVEKIVSYDKYQVYCYNIDKRFTGSKKSMKIDTEPNESKAKNKFNKLKGKMK